MSDNTPAHGGTLLNLYTQGAALEAAKEQAKENISWDLNKRQMCDIELILNGGFSPLHGFMGEADYKAVLDNMRLADGTLWPMPINLDVSESFAKQVSLGQTITLRDAEGVVIANMTVSDCWKADKAREAQAVFGTDKDCHPGIHYLHTITGDYYLGGSLVGVTPPLYYDFNQYRDTPASLRSKFTELDWENVIALQTRNPMHRAHVIMSKRLMAENNANFVVHTAVGMTKPGDLDHYCRVRCYEKVLNRYPQASAALSLIPLAMRMAGPREALWQAIIRQNYGFSHFIVGHDHAGPGLNDEGCAFYEPDESQHLVVSFQQELAIKILPAPFLLYSQDRGEFCTQEQLLPGEEGLYLSGAELRETLKSGDEVPEWFAFPEIIEELQQTLPPRSRQGFTVFFTGLSGSGKSTLANGLMIRLRERGGRPVSLLDGDVVRKNLSSELNFSKQHRDLNIQRIGYVASEITKNGGVAICAPIAPYTAGRRSIRDTVEELGSFIEIHVNTPLEICEGRDRKGLYAMARAGKVTGFTGIDDPYEAPENPELRIDTSQHTMPDAIDLVMLRLEEIGVI